jgi:hypothetical protein
VPQPRWPGSTTAAYAQTKTTAVLFAVELDRQWAGTGLDLRAGDAEVSRDVRPLAVGELLEMSRRVQRRGRQLGLEANRILRKCLAQALSGLAPGSERDGRGVGEVVGAVLFQAFGGTGADALADVDLVDGHTADTRRVQVVHARDVL